MSPAPSETAGELTDEPSVEAGEEYGRRLNLIVSAILTVIGVVAAIMAWQLGLGSPDEPGPGLWPLIVSVAMVVLAVIQLVRPSSIEGAERFTTEIRVVAIGAVSLVAYTALFEQVGFEMPTLALLVLWMKVLGRESWVSTIATSIGGVIAFYLIFITALGVSLPHLI